MNQQIRWITMISLAFISTLALIDIATDKKAMSSLHIILEMSGAILCLILLVFIWLSWQRQLKDSVIHNQNLETELKAFRSRHQDALEKMRLAIQDQFQHWQLSPSEKKVAEALLRGYSLNEIAARKGRQAKTIRNQATVIYEKSGMLGRAELAAFFLGEILGEDPDDPDSSAS